jgi:hypothetical protein
MENIWNESQEKVHNGSTFRINLEKRNLLIDGKYIIKEGKYEGSLGYNTDSQVNALLVMAEEFYWQYLHSVPSARNDAKYKRYFRALPEHELSEEDMLYGENRELAQLRLELYLLIAILNGNLKWDEFAKDKWFWQSKKHTSLIILKQWIENNNK